MNPTNFAVKASLVASIILSGSAFAQTLPDEINHEHYRNIYNNLETILTQKTAEYERLASQKAEIEKNIKDIELDLIEVPARTNELRSLIANKRQEIAQLDSEIQGLEGVLGKIIEDLRKIDNMIAQLQTDLNQESSRSQQIAQRRNQVAHDVAQLNQRLEREVREEQQSVQVLNRIQGEMDGAINRRQEVERERSQLLRDVDRFKGEIVQARNNVNQNNNQLANKKPNLAEAQAKLPGVKAELAQEEAKISQIDVTLNPKKAQLNAMKAELARLSPNIARLQNENKALEQKIANNQARINSSNVNALVARRDNLENEVSGVKAKISSNNQKVVDLQEAMKPTLGKINELTEAMKQALRTRNLPEAARLKKEIDALNATILPQRQEAARLTKETEVLAISIAPKQNEINSLNNQISTANAQNTALQNEIDSAKVKIAENDKKILEESQANSGLAQQIATLDAEVKALEAQREPAAKKAQALRQQEGNLTAKIAELSKDIQRIEAETQRLTARIAEMEKTITTAPQELRRMEAHSRQLDEKARELRVQVDREQRLLSRIRQDRMAIQQQRDSAQQVLDQVNSDLAGSERLAGAIRNKLQEEQREREALTRYNQASIQKLDSARGAKANADKVIADSSEEIRQNDQHIATISSELPKFRSELSVISPKVSAADSARNTAQNNVNNANTQYQNRLSLYQNYLAEAQAKGAEKASIGSNDGAKAGAIDAKTKANKLASESASAEGKWEALRRGYVRGEIAGYQNGFNIGLNSTPDAARGEEDGRIAGARRAKDHANLVVKPEIYLEELERRLREDETSSKPQIAMMIQQEISNIKSMARQLQQTIPDLSASELAEASRIVSSLDNLIAQSDIEIKEILEVRKNLSEASNVYSVPGAGINANNANCSDVYKQVKAFVDACKGSYVIRYQSLYNSAHADAFKRDYTSAFNEQIDRVFESELSRLYAGYLNEASKVGKEVGISSGKKEVYQQSFNRAENAAYGGNLPAEVARVETEAVNLVQDHLNANAALTLKGSAKLSTASIYGIAPGTEADLKMLIKNIGSQASLGNSLVQVTEMSSNVATDRKEAPIAPVGARSHADLAVLKVKVSDAAVPGSKVVIAGEIVHPGNHYRSSRVESFRIETVLGINPAVDSSVDLDSTPDIAGIFGTKKHNIDLTITPKFAGVDQGYEVSLEEVGSSFVEITARPGRTEVLNRGAQKKVRFTYKLQKAAKGKTVTLKLTVKNDGKIVSQQELQVKPK